MPGPLDSWCPRRQLAPPEKEPSPRTEALGPIPVPCPQSLPACSQVTRKLTRGPGRMTVPLYRSDTSSHCPEGGKANLRRRGGPLQFSQWEICLFLDREEADGGCEVIQGNHNRRKRKICFPETKCVRGPLGSVWLTGLTCRSNKIWRRVTQTTTQTMGPVCKKPTNPGASSPADDSPHGSPG